MISKEKPCKGTGKAKGLGCGKLTFHRIYGLGKMCGCYSDWLLNSEQGKIKLAKATLKATKPRLELEQAAKDRCNRSTLSKEIVKTQMLVNAYVRQRDKGKPCISQNIGYLKNFDAGHLYSKNQYSAIRFDLDNIHGQSIYANRYLEGDFDNYLINLETRIGKEKLDALNEKAKQCKREVKKWTIPELKEIQENIKNLK